MTDRCFKSGLTANGTTGLP